MAKSRSSPMFLGLVLVAVGAFLLATRFFPITWTHALLLGLGLALATSAILQRSTGALVTGMLLLGLGAGVTLGERAVLGLPATQWVLLCLAGAFLAIYLFGLILGISRHWWPLVPGVVLALMGGGVQAASRITLIPEPVKVAARTWWPAGLILLGGFLLYRAFRR